MKFEISAMCLLESRNPRDGESASSVVCSFSVMRYKRMSVDHVRRKSHGE